MKHQPVFLGMSGADLISILFCGVIIYGFVHLLLLVTDALKGTTFP